MDGLHFGMFVVLMVSCISGMIAVQMFLSRLRKLHPSAWVQLRRPAIFANRDNPSTLTILRFLWRKDYEALPDPKTVAFGACLRKFVAFYLLYLLLVIVVGFLTTDLHL